MRAGTLLRVLGVSCVLVTVVAAAAWAGPKRALPANDPPSLAIFMTLSEGTTEYPGFFRFGSDFRIVSGVNPSDVPLTTDKPLKVPEKMTPPAATIQRGLDGNRIMWDWHQQALSGNPAGRRDVVIRLFDFELKPVAAYRLDRAWPSKYELVEAGTTEQLTIVAERLVRIS
jgi:hypothetical protein